MEKQAYRFSRLSEGGIMLLSSADSFFDLSSNAYLIDIEGNILECNEAQAKSAGASKPSDVIGRNCYYDLGDQEAGLVVRKNNEEICKMKEPRLLIEHVIVSNRRHSFLSYKMPIINSHKKVVSLVGTSIELNSDMSEKFLSITKHSVSNYKMTSDSDGSPISIEIEGKTLTKLERSCLHYLISGLSEKKIANELDLSPRTIAFYIGRMREKFHCVSNMELIIKAISAS